MSDSNPAPAARGPQWSNSYESQLSDSLLAWLHTALRTRTPADKEILKRLPPWKSGRFAGQPPSLATLSNIRDRLEMEEDFQANEQTVDSVLAAEREANPDITQEQLDRIGLRLFTTLAIRKRDTGSFVKLQRTRKEREALELEKKRFMRETAGMVVDFAMDQRAKDIAAQNAPRAEKVEQMGRHIFKDLW